MYTKRLLISFVCVLNLITFITCNKKIESLTPEQQNVVKKLEQMGIHYDVDTFFDYIGKGDINVVNLFLAGGMSPNARMRRFCALDYAITFGNTEVLKLLIDKGANVNVRDKNGITPLMYAAALGGRVDKIKILIEKGAEINAKDKFGGTALMKAAFVGDIETVKLLVENGANIDVKDKAGKSALMIAKENNHTEVVQLLKQVGAKE